MRATVFVGTSLDGFLARSNGDFDFLFPSGNEPHGYDEFMATVDALVIGRNSFEVVTKMIEWPYGRKPVIVLSNSPLAHAPIDVPIERMTGMPQEVVERLAARGFQHICVDSGITVLRFLSVGLIDRFIITRVPVIIGAGIPLFGPTGHDIALEHIATRTYATGLVKSEYAVAARSTTA